MTCIRYNYNTLQIIELIANTSILKFPNSENKHLQICILIKMFKNTQL